MFFAPGWLAALERCAEETGADIVSPVTCIGRPLHSLIHHAGGSAAIIERDGRRLFLEHQGEELMRLEDIRDRLVRAPTGTCEFHSVLVRSTVFERHGLLDENLMTSYDHTDLSMKVNEAGGTIYLEPAAVVTYVPKKLEWRELPFFMLRWNRHRARHTVSSFLAKRNAEEYRPGCNEIEFMQTASRPRHPEASQMAARACGLARRHLADRLDRARPRGDRTPPLRRAGPPGQRPRRARGRRRPLASCGRPTAGPAAGPSSRAAPAPLRVR